MKLARPLRMANPVPCPYLPDRWFVQEYFFAAGLDAVEFGQLLSAGWRRFGRFFFRPRCPECRLCVPIRIPVRRLEASRSQRRVVRRGAAIESTICHLEPRDEIWSIYEKHSDRQFGRDSDRNDFEKTFFEPAVPAFQMEYRYGKTLAGLGFLDVADQGGSSVYFVFDPAFARYSLGTLSVFRESRLLENDGREWYYLGYWVPGCPAMEYKARFRPHQLYDWLRRDWVDPKDHPAATDSKGISSLS